MAGTEQQSLALPHPTRIIQGTFLPLASALVAAYCAALSNPGPAAAGGGQKDQDVGSWSLRPPA